MEPGQSARACCKMCFRTAPRPVDHEIMNKELTALRCCGNCRFCSFVYGAKYDACVSYGVRTPNPPCNRFVLLDACCVRPYHGIGQVHPGSFRIPSLASRDSFLFARSLSGGAYHLRVSALFLRFLSIFSTALRKKEGCLS